MRLFTVASTALTLISVAQAFDHFPFPCRQTYTGKKRKSINFEKKKILNIS